MAAPRPSTSAQATTAWSAACILLIILGAVLYFTRPETHPILLAFRVGLVAVGLVGLIIITFVSGRKRDDADVGDLARQILAQQKQLYGAPHEHSPATLEEFPEVDRGFYDQARGELETRGFRYLDDVENTTLSRTHPALRTFARVMVGDGDTVVARIFQLLPLGREGRDIRTIELTTEFNDFTFLVTTNAMLVIDPVEVRGIAVARFPGQTSIDDLLFHHRAAVEATMKKNPSAQPVKCPTLDAVLNSTRHAHAVRAVHRKRNGYVTLDDMKLIRGEPLTDLDRKIFDEINQLEAAERSADANAGGEGES